ncbi:MAG: RIP metalloprotease RseP [Bacilli bacterium]|nr:RIP metalloprotease RseP [Bacilli bacterium]
MLGVLWNLFLFIVILSVIVFIHELGHFTWAKICGVYVYEFAIGMGPKLFGKKIGETEYNVRAIPLGGFCSMAGEDLQADDEEKIPKNRRLQSKNVFQRFLIMFFGPGNNFLLALFLLFFIALIWGETTMKPVVSDVLEKYPAAEAGISSGDKILEINGHKVSTSDDVSLYLAIANTKKNNIIKVVKPNGYEVKYEVMPKKVKQDGKESYYFGITMEQKRTHGFVNAITYTFKKFGSLMKQMWLTVKYLVTGGIGLNQLSGPVGIYNVVGQQSKAGLSNILFLVAYLSINVGFLNLLPVPAFDGGHILFILIEMIRRKPVNPNVENMIHTVGLAALMILMLFVTIHDIIMLF